MELRTLDETQIRALHEKQMHRDFPPSELKGVESILSLCRRGEYDVLAADLYGELVAYALVFRPKDGRAMLLDYLAVEPHLRGKGLGTQLLHQLCAYYAEAADSLMIECERPKAAPDEAEARRRIRFYEHGGASMTDVRIWLFDVEYSILVLPCKGHALNKERDWADVMLGMYRSMLPKALYEQNVRLIRG